MSTNVDINERPDPDHELIKIAEYVSNDLQRSEIAFETARNCLIDTLGCGFLALRYPECSKHLGPIMANSFVINGSRVPGTSFELDPVKAAWDIGCIIRWLDFNDTWLAAEWGHPSDNLGAILAVSDYVCRNPELFGHRKLYIKDLLEAMIKAHEIQGVLAIKNSFNKVGLDHVLLVRVASTAVATKLLGGSTDQIIDAVSQAWVDGCSLRTYRHAPNAGSRKSWAAGDATSRAVRLAMITLKGEMGIPTVLSAPKWGYYDVLFKGNQFEFDRDYGSYVMENVLFKISYPAEFHAQTAVEAAVTLHQQVVNRLDEIEKIHVNTHESAIRIISKEGPLSNPADRDHCLQYMIAVPLITGVLTADHYEDSFHLGNPMIDKLRSKMVINEEKRYSIDYLDPNKRSIANAIKIEFKDGTTTDQVEVEYPIGHKNRRAEGIPVLEKKFKSNLATRFPAGKCAEIFEICSSQNNLEEMLVSDFVNLFVT